MTLSVMFFDVFASDDFTEFLVSEREETPA
jgi:hypothetical protein